MKLGTSQARVCGYTSERAAGKKQLNWTKRQKTKWTTVDGYIGTPKRYGLSPQQRPSDTYPIHYLNHPLFAVLPMTNADSALSVHSLSHCMEVPTVPA